MTCRGVVSLILAALILNFLISRVASLESSIVISESYIQDLKTDLTPVKVQSGSFLQGESLILFSRAHLLAFSYNHKTSSDNVTAQDMHGKDIIIVGVEMLLNAFKIRLEMINEQRRRNNETEIVPASISRFSKLFQDCLLGDPVDNYDVFVVSSWDFYTEIAMRMIKSVFPPALYPWEEYLFYEDFTMPIVVDHIKTDIISPQLNESDITNSIDRNFKYYFKQIYSNGTTYALDTPQDVAKGIVYLLYRFGFGNITLEQQEFIRRFMNSTSKFIDFYPNFNLMRYIQSYEQYTSIFNGTSWIKKTRVEFQEIFCFSQISLQYFVCSDTHLSLSASIFDAMNISAMGFGIFYFLCLFTVCNKKALKRRLIVPYVLPILAMISAVFFSYFSDTMCTSLKLGFLTCFIGGMIGVYSFVIIRFSYLRHLYLFLENANSKRIKFHKFMASTLFGVVGSILSGVIYALFWLIIVIPFLATSKGNSVRTTIDIIIMTEVFSGCIIGFFVISVDVIVNWKKIRERGIISFFTFEDPFFLRWDMLSFFSIFISLTIIIVLFSTSSSKVFDYYDVVSGFFHMTALISVYFLSGFTAIIFEWVKILQRLFNKLKSSSANSGNQKEDDEESVLEVYLKDGAFLNLFKAYCAKEFSLENVMLYEELETVRVECEYENRANISFASFDRIYNTFFKKYSKYEINLPSRVYKEVDSLYERAFSSASSLLLSNNNLMMMNNKQQGGQQIEVSYKEFVDLIKTDLIINLNDTFERLKDTKQFKRWKVLRKIQEQQSVV